MQLLEISGAVRPIYGSLGVKRLSAVSLMLPFADIARNELKISVTVFFSLTMNVIS